MKIDLQEMCSSGKGVFIFPDGQPHVSLNLPLYGEKEVDLYASITTPNELMVVLMAKDILDRAGVHRVKLHLGYLMAARMDRPMPIEMDTIHPFSLKVVADMLNTGGFDMISLFDPHSDVAPALLNARTVLPTRNVSLALSRIMADAAIVIPDAGAIKRTYALLENMSPNFRHRDTIQCLKHRDMATGALSDFQVVDYCKGRDLLIVDDLCDGGGTFVGLAKKLREAGANSVHLYVSHGVFSKGWNLEGIDSITTTTSYHRDIEHPKHVFMDSWH